MILFVGVHERFCFGYLGCCFGFFERPDLEVTLKFYYFLGLALALRDLLYLFVEIEGPLLKICTLLFLGHEHVGWQVRKLIPQPLSFCF